MIQIQSLYKRFFKPKTNLAVGLDIGNSSVKIVQILTRPGSPKKELVSFDINTFRSLDSIDVVDSIKAVIANAHVTTNVVNTSVSGQAVIVRYIQMPRMTQEQLEKALKLGVGKYVPFSLDDVNYDFQILEDGRKEDKMMRVLLVAAKKKIIEERIKILRAAGLTPNVIDVDSFATVNSFQLVRQENKGVIAVLDVGADITSTTVLQDNVPYFNRDVPLGGNHLTTAIVEEFGISQKEADTLKHDPKTRYGDLVNAIRPVLDSLAREIHLSFNYAESQLGKSIQKIYLTGGTAKFKGIDKVLNSILGVDVEVWDPTRTLELNAELSKERLAEVGPLLTVSVGLALRG